MRSEELLLDSEAYGVMILAYDILHDRFANEFVPCDVMFKICSDIIDEFLESEEYFLPTGFYDALTEFLENKPHVVDLACLKHNLAYL